MSLFMRWMLGSIAGLSVLFILLVLFHLGPWEFVPLLSSLIGGGLTLYSALFPAREGESVEPWLGNERLAWVLIGNGLLLWGGGESVWRYYSFLHQSPFPSLADVGYASLPPLVFSGLLLQPSSGVGSRRVLMLLDSLIIMGSMLTIGWFLLLGSLALSSTQDLVAKFLGLYYPTTDIALLSCVILLLFRGQGSLYQATARRISLIVIGVGLCFFACSDFLFNVQQNAGTYVDGTWVDLGWPLGMVTIGVAAYLRRFLPLTSGDMIEQRLRRYAERPSIGMAQLAMYGMVGILCLVLILSVFSTDTTQLVTRPVLVLATMLVVALVVIRQILTILENEHLTRRQAHALERLEMAHLRIEEQARMITEQKVILEEGISHLKDVQARIANGDLHVRARLMRGELLPLAAGLNLMAERLAHLEQDNQRTQLLTRTLQELITSIENYRHGKPFTLSPAYRMIPEMRRLLYVLGFKEKMDAPISTSGFGSSATSSQAFRQPSHYPAGQQASQPIPGLGQQHTGAASLSRPIKLFTGEGKITLLSEARDALPNNSEGNMHRS